MLTKEELSAKEIRIPQSIDLIDTLLDDLESDKEIGGRFSQLKKYFINNVGIEFKWGPNQREYFATKGTWRRLYNEFGGVREKTQEALEYYKGATGEDFPLTSHYSIFDVRNMLLNKFCEE